MGSLTMGGAACPDRCFKTCLEASSLWPGMESSGIGFSLRMCFNMGRSRFIQLLVQLEGIQALILVSQPAFVRCAHAAN